MSHPAVADAAVVPSPDEEFGEVPAAFVVVRKPVSDQEIKEYVAERVAPHKRLRAVHFIEEVPKAPTGKILRRTSGGTATGVCSYVDVAPSFH